MKRFFLAAVLALALHGLLFWTSPALLGKKKLPKALKQAVTLNLTTRKAPVSAPKPSTPAPVPTPAQATKQTEPKAPSPPPPPKAEKIPAPDKVKPQAAKKETPPIPEKATPTPIKKVSLPPKKIVKPKKKPDREQKPIKAVQAPKPLPPEPAKKSSETTPPVPEKIKMAAPPLKDMAKSEKETGPSLNQDNLTSVKALPLPSSASDGEEIKKTEPSYKNNPPPEYPGKARRRGYAGTVVLKVLVSENGIVMQVRLSKSSGYGILDRAAEESVSKWTFEPGAMGAKKVEMWVNVPVRFDLKTR